MDTVDAVLKGLGVMYLLPASLFFLGLLAVAIMSWSLSSCILLVMFLLLVGIPLMLAMSPDPLPSDSK